uniref:6-phosphogluconolactonase n=1 Tax=Panagrolaimus superbus TaxID=310955 RepID=A0A914YIH5_9BILA
MTLFKYAYNILLQMDTFAKDPVTSGNKNVIVTENKNDMISIIFNEFSKIVQDSQSLVTVGLSGGSMVGIMSDVISRLDQSLKDKLRLFCVDERLVSLDDEDSNTGAYLKVLGNEFKKQFVIVEEINDANKAAKEFEENLKALKPETTESLPQFDVLFLGMGPDGHTCSLFPNHELLNYNGSSWILPIENSPKPPPRRVTVSLPVCNAAKNVIFIVTGESKAEILKEIIADKSESYPAGLVKATKLKWILDKPAAKLLGIEAAKF